MSDKTKSKNEPPAKPESKRQRKIRKLFEEYHAENPHVFKYMKKLSRELIKEGWTRLSSALMVEFVRLRMPNKINGDYGYRISNDFKPHYGELFKAIPEFSAYYSVKGPKSKGRA